MPTRTRDYRRERLMESPARRKARAARNKARRAMIRAGKVKKGNKSVDVDHKKPIRSGGKTTKGNIRLRSAKANRKDNGGKGGRPKGGRKAVPRSSKKLKR